MKKIIALILSVLTLVSSTAVFAYGADSSESQNNHTHSRNYFPTCTDKAHAFSCSECTAVITEPHKLDAEGKCDCGYIGAVESESAIARFFNNMTESFKKFFDSIAAFFKNLFSFSFNNAVYIR